MHSTVETREAARKAWEFISQNPERHDQNSWIRFPDGHPSIEEPTEQNICDSTLCVAGTVAFNKHGLQVFSNDWQAVNVFSNVGQDELGLTYEEAQHLFYDCSNRKALEVLKGIAKGEWLGDATR